MSLRSKPLAFAGRGSRTAKELSEAGGRCMRSVLFFVECSTVTGGVFPRMLR